MEEGLQSSPNFNDSIDTDDSKYLCGLSTILVANIQELKDRISQVELIFCSQLFPKFQSRSKSLEKRILEARKATYDEWKKKETFLLNQIKEVNLEKQYAQEEVQRLNKSLEETKTSLINKEELLSKYQDEKVQLLVKIENQERNGEIIASLKEQLAQKNGELANEKKLQEKLLQQIDLKDHNLLTEQSKRKDLFEEFSKLKDNYKHLKSQYTFLLSKCGDNREHKPRPNRITEEKDSPSPLLSKRSPQDSEHKGKDVSPPSSRPIELKKLVSNQDSGFIKPSHVNSRISPKNLPSITKTEPSIGKKRSAASSWRETRQRQEQGGGDPHDDFLDTPMEIVRNLNIGPKEEVQDLPVVALNDMDFNNSDDENQELINPDAAAPQKQNVSILGPVANKGFKYVEPVRKKTERENLRGVECKQCKKFYDAVLPHDGTDNGQKTMRCEHHDGVSRHRYRYAPPMTPEGFWNIGFESEL